MKSTTNLTLNLALPNIAQIAYAVQGDQLSRELTIQLVDGSVPWEPPAGALATVRYRKPDGTTGFYDTMEDGTTPAVTVSGSTVTLILANQALTVPGVVLMQLNFYDTYESRVTTFAWSLIVQPSVLTDATFISKDYYNILTQQIAAVLEAATSLAGLTATASGLPTGSDPTVTVTGGSGGVPYKLAFAIPAGPVGPPEIPTAASTYQEGSSPTTPPTGTWQNNPPTVAQGNYLWTRTILTYSTGATATFYSVARQGMDGAGTVSSVDGVDVASGTTNVPLGAVRYNAAQSLTSAQQGQARENIGLLDYVYPVGSIYMSVNSTSPATLFGGTWEQIQDTFLLAAGSTYAAGSTGGEAAHTLTVDEMPNHTHMYAATRTANSGSNTFRPVSYGESGATEINMSYTGGGQAHNNMPPYLAVYVWKRTA